jgi:hypothetical protein
VAKIPQAPGIRVRWVVACELAGLATLAWGRCVQTTDPYWAGALSNIGTTLLLVGVLIFFERRIVDLTARALSVRDSSPDRKAVAQAETLVRILASSRRPTAAIHRTTTRASNVDVPVLPLDKPEWLGPLDPSLDFPFKMTSTDKEKLAYDAAVILRRESMGVRLWDGSLLYSKNDGPLGGELRVGVCNYFAYVSLADKVFDESKSRWGEKTLLDILASPERGLSGDDARIRPITIAGSATCVFETTEGRMVAMQRRSHRVVSARGFHAVTPVFGMEPNVAGGRRSAYGILAYNFMKEFLEELFDQEDAQRAGDKPRVDDVDAIFQSEHGRRLSTELGAHSLQLSCTGVAVDPADGSLDFMILAHFRDPAFFAHVRSGAVGSWESESGDGRSRITFRPLFSDEVDQLMGRDQMVATSIYSLDLARQAMRDLDKSAGTH